MNNELWGNIIYGLSSGAGFAIYGELNNENDYNSNVVFEDISKKPSWSAVERPEGAQRTSVGGGGSMVAFGKKKAGAVVPEQSLIKAISTYLKEDTPKYNKKAVEAAIKRDKSIGKKEAKAIHGLLRGRQKSDS